MIQQGNDTVKEGMIFVEDELLRSRQDIDPERTAVYGFSGGGTWSAMYAGVSESVKCMVSVGGGIYNLGKVISRIPAMQKRQVKKHWGCSEKEIPKISGTINFDLILPQIKCRCLLVHGSKEIYDTKNRSVAEPEMIY